MSVKNSLESALKQAMRDKDELKRNTLRLALSTIKLAEVDAGKELDDLSVFALLQKEIKTKEETIAEAVKGGRDEMASSLQPEIEFLKGFLPKELSNAELSDLVNETINETGAQSIKEMGKVMKIAIEKAAGQASNDRISKMIKEILTTEK
jgi:uncharacterized protein YqeY